MVSIVCRHPYYYVGQLAGIGLPYGTASTWISKSMKTIQLTIDEKLLKAIDRMCRTRRTTRSAWIRSALQTELSRESVRAEESLQRVGYERHPVIAGEFDVWFDEQDWVSLSLHR